MIKFNKHNSLISIMTGREPTKQHITANMSNNTQQKESRNTRNTDKHVNVFSHR